MKVLSNDPKGKQAFYVGDVDDPSTHALMSVTAYVNSVNNTDGLGEGDISNLMSVVNNGIYEFPEDIRQKLSDAAGKEMENGEKVPDDVVEIYERQFNELVEAHQNSQAIKEKMKSAKEDAKIEKQKQKEKEKAEKEAELAKLAEQALETGNKVAVLANSAKQSAGTLSSDVVKGLPEGVSVNLDTGEVDLPKDLSLDQLIQTVAVSTITQNQTEKASTGTSWLIGDAFNRMKEEHGSSYEKIITQSGLLETLGLGMPHLRRMAQTCKRFGNKDRAATPRLKFSHFQDACITLPKTEAEAKECQDDVLALLKKFNKGVIKKSADGTKTNVIPGTQKWLRPALAEIRESYGIGKKKSDNPRIGFTVIGIDEDGEAVVSYAIVLNPAQIEALLKGGYKVISERDRYNVQVSGNTEKIEFVDPESIVVEPPKVDDEDGGDEEE